METEYKPTIKEILREMFDGARDFWKGLLTTAIPIIELPYMLPTAIRHGNRLEEPKNISYKTSYVGGFILGITTGVFANIAQFPLYTELIARNHSEALLIPVATNVISGICEWRRIARKKIEEIHKPEEPLEIIITEENSS